MRGNPDKIKAFRWKKGQPSPNPGGRPRTAMLSRAIRDRLECEVTHKGETLTVAEAIADVLIREALAGDIRAIREIADRAEGKSIQAVSVGERSSQDMTPEERDARIRELLTKVVERERPASQRE